MKPGSFILNGERSEDYGTFIQERPIIETPRRRVEFRQAYGQSGDLPYDEEAYDNTYMRLLLYATGNQDRTASENRDKIQSLFDSGSYMDFIPYFDPNKIYKVMLSSAPAFTSSYMHGEGQSFDLELTVKPYKYYLDSKKITLTQPGVITNTTSKPSLPEIKIFATGDVTLDIDGRPFVIKNVVDHIVLNSAVSYAYKELTGGLENQNFKTYTRRYPYLGVGSNNLSWTGNVTKVEVEPRWRTLA